MLLHDISSAARLHVASSTVLVFWQTAQEWAKPRGTGDIPRRFMDNFSTEEHWKGMA